MPLGTQGVASHEVTMTFQEEYPTATIGVIIQVIRHQVPPVVSRRRPVQVIAAMHQVVFAEKEVFCFQTETKCH